MTPEERAKRTQERIQKLNELVGKAKNAMDNALNKGADAADNLGRKIDGLLGPQYEGDPQDRPSARPPNDVAKANDVAKPKAPKKKTKRVYRF